MLGRIRTGALLVAVVVGTVACAPAGADLSADPAADPVADLLERTLPAGPGGTVIAAHGDRIVHCDGFGLADREARIAATCDTAYDVMSITKQFTAAAVLKLEMMGRLRVSDPISTYVGPVPADKQRITLHHLLTHTSGLVEGMGDDYDVLSRDAMIAGALASPLVSTPGERFHYSNLGYSVLAAIVEEVSGVGYEQFLATHLFGPAGMTSTGYVLPQWERERVAVEYDPQGVDRGRPDERPWAADGPYWNLRGNGGILSTARDMFRWHRALTDDTVLSANARSALFTPHVAEPGSQESYAYGWGIVDTDHGRVARHDGGNDWAFAMYARSLDSSPDDAVMSFWVSNSAYREPDWNLEDLEPDLTLNLLDLARATGRP
ncbi:serine hydrolase domain-containing protein [Pseudonocardia sp. TRM90224]|uniref:serine hydrolase domain-containing protein n=1 Tax=Pseudonocardia sp. TRM90224 TaxID=2812678 RepID=UPI001E2994CC|nr:serine hydrolase domain-containing protein [Pseudonocardia sp. TRM90224]